MAARKEFGSKGKYSKPSESNIGKAVTAGLRVDKAAQHASGKVAPTSPSAAFARSTAAAAGDWGTSFGGSKSKKRTSW